MNVHNDVLSKFSSVTLIKEAGQKTVFRATDSNYGLVALKIGTYHSELDLERIKREVSLLNSIDSFYYPKQYDFYLETDNRFVIIEEYIESKPLKECLTEYQNVKKALTLIKELTIGLKILWDRQVVHRDLKPDNILITPQGSAKIIDLGIARLLDLDSLTRDLARGGPGTAKYAAPEQFLNKKHGEDGIGIRTDQFALGIVLLQLLLGGNHPFDPNLVKEGESIEHNIMADRWFKQIFLDKDIKPLEPLISKLLSHEPYGRYRKPETLLENLNTLLQEFEI
jgi:serine/threonine protein kinase